MLSEQSNLQIAKLLRKSDITKSCSVSTYEVFQFLLLLVFQVKNLFRFLECLYLLSTDTSLNNAEIVRTYGNRWSIECFFKASKSFLKLGSEFQSRSYGAMISHTTIMFTQYIILEWLCRNQNDQKSYGELFFHVL